MGTFVENVNLVATGIQQVYDNFDEILLADDNAAICTAMANVCTSTYDQFDNRYLGAKATPPLVDNDGNALVYGALYFDTTQNYMKVWSNAGWINAGSSVNGTTERYTYTATAGQTVFVATYEAGYIDVFLNGSKLQNGVDFTAVTATDITLTSPASLGDVVDIICYAVFELSTAPTKDVVAYTVSTVADLASVPSSYTTAIVKDLDRGGTFIWSSTGTANGGTVFAGATGYWNRQYSGEVSVKWFEDAQSAFLFGGEIDCSGVSFNPTVPFSIANNTTILNGSFYAKLINNTSYSNGVFNLVSNTNIKFLKCNFFGNADINTSKDAHGISIDRNGGVGCSKITIQDCTFDGISGFGIASNTIVGATQRDWIIKDNVFNLYGKNWVHTGVMAGIDLFTYEDFNTTRIDGVEISGNNFRITTGYEGTAFKVQGAVNAFVFDNNVYGGTVVDYSSSCVQLYMAGSFYDNKIYGASNIRSCSVTGSQYLIIEDCYFANGLNFYAYDRTTPDINCNYVSVDRSNLGIYNYIGNGSNIKFKSCTAGELQLTNLTTVNIVDCDINRMYLGATVSGLNIEKSTIRDFQDNQTYSKTIKNSKISVANGAYNTVVLSNGVYEGNTFYGQGSAISGAYLVEVKTGARLINNKYTYYDLDSTLLGSYTGYIKVNSSSTKGSIVIRETTESFINGTGQYTVYDSGLLSNQYVIDATPTQGTYFANDKIFDTYLSAGGFIGWVCTASGTLGTLTGVTATTTASSATITVNTTVGLWTEMFISIVGVTGTKRIKSISGTTIELYTTCDASVTSANVAYVAPTLKTFGAITA